MLVIYMELYKEIEKSFPLLEKLFTVESLLEFKNAPVSDLSLYHFSLGLWIRNNILYKEDNNLRRLFLKNDIIHADEMSSFMINLFHYHLHSLLP